MKRSILLALSISLFSLTINGQNISSNVPKTPDVKGRYIIYLHGRIVEEQGENAVSPEYGPYEYNKILVSFKTGGFNVISEIRPKDTDAGLYADKVAKQIDTLIRLKVPAENITVIGASKGAAIAILASSKLKNEKVNFVLMGICGADDEEYFPKDKVKICGNILSIYEKSDKFGQSCQNVITNGACVVNTNEIALDLKVGHAFLYKPYREWVMPSMQWAVKHQFQPKAKPGEPKSDF